MSQDGRLQGGGSGGGSGSLPYPSGGAYMQQLYAQQQLADDLRKFWEEAGREVEEHSDALGDFKNQALPLARIKKVGGTAAGPGGRGRGAEVTAWRAAAAAWQRGGGQGWLGVALRARMPGKFAFGGCDTFNPYLPDDEERWLAHASCALVPVAPPLHPLPCLTPACSSLPACILASDHEERRGCAHDQRRVAGAVCPRM